MVSLESSPVFNRLEPAHLGRLQQAAVERSFDAGRDIFREGDAGDGVYLVKSGCVEIWVPVESGQRQVFREIHPGELFGEMAVLEDKPRSANAVAKVPTRVYFLPRQVMLELVEVSPPLALALLQEISGRLREFNGQYLSELLQAERLGVVGRFARSIIHDLKNPLNIIGLTADMASMQGISEENRLKAMQTIRSQVERISEMVSEVLEFTQGSHDDVVLPPMDYARFVQQVIEDLRGETALKLVEIELQSDAPSLPLLINPKRLRRIFQNLAHNATDAMPAGGKLMIRFRTTPAEVITEFEDTGPGIAPAIIDRLFQPFATFGKVHGTGLGLSICKRIVEDHQGWMKCLSQPGHGAIFNFGLPRQPELEAVRL